MSLYSFLFFKYMNKSDRKDRLFIEICVPVKDF